MKARGLSIRTGALYSLPNRAETDALRDCADDGGLAFVVPNKLIPAWLRSANYRAMGLGAAGGFTFYRSRAHWSCILSRHGFDLLNRRCLVQPRIQPLELPKKAAVLAVVRIEALPQHQNVQTQALISGIREIAALPNVRGIQIDFDARRSERNLYRMLLKSVRMQTAKPIGITALASWCGGDRRLEQEPIAEAVPMFFRMGRGESREMAALFAAHLSACLWMKCLPARRPAGIRRIYLFSPRAWTEAIYFVALHRIQDWK